MNTDIIAPARRTKWITYNVVDRILNDKRIDQGERAESLVKLGLSARRVAALLRGQRR
jgi:hypothetical protein